jgi:hypothetical protein
MLNKLEEREIESLVEGFIATLDKLGFTCAEPKDVGLRGDALFDHEDYKQLENILITWSENEKIRKHT